MYGQASMPAPAATEGTPCMYGGASVPARRPRRARPTHPSAFCLLPSPPSPPQPVATPAPLLAPGLLLVDLAHMGHLLGDGRLQPERAVLSSGQAAGAIRARGCIVVPGRVGHQCAS